MNRRRKINLRKTHILLFRLLCLFSIGDIIIGLGIFLNPYFMYANFKILSDIFPIEIWATLWVISGLSMLLGIIFKYYPVCKAGLVLTASLCIAWAMAQFTGQFFGYTGIYSFISTIIYTSCSATLIILLFEPPINPQTAIGEKND